MDYLERRDPIAKRGCFGKPKKSKNILLRNDRARIWKINQRAALLKIQNYRMIKVLENLRESLELEQEELINDKNRPDFGRFLIDRLDLKGKKSAAFKFLQNTPIFNQHGRCYSRGHRHNDFVYQRKIRNHYDIQLHEEIQLVGFPIS